MRNHLRESIIAPALVALCSGGNPSAVSMWQDVNPGVMDTPPSELGVADCEISLSGIERLAPPPVAPVTPGEPRILEALAKFGEPEKLLDQWNPPLRPPSLSICTHSGATAALGISDHNTILVPEGLLDNCYMLGVVLLHELQHLCNAQDSGKVQDPFTAGVPTQDPSGSVSYAGLSDLVKFQKASCTHAEYNILDLVEIAKQIVQVSGDPGLSAEDRHAARNQLLKAATDTGRGYRHYKVLPCFIAAIEIDPSARSQADRLSYTTQSVDVAELNRKREQAREDLVAEAEMAILACGINPHVGEAKAVIDAAKGTEGMP